MYRRRPCIRFLGYNYLQLSPSGSCASEPLLDNGVMPPAPLTGPGLSPGFEDTKVLVPATGVPQGFPSPPPVPDTVPASTSGTPEDNAAHLQVRVPAGADLWFEGVRMPQTGEVREFTSLELKPGKGYVYDVRARWTEDGRMVDRTRTVRVRANQWTEVDMTQPEPADRKGR
jgi:uncharacterized protein (TIGR03000 family)